ncbi:ATP-dependent endonuclease [Leclercia adecarboxylata]|uniref:ATP-dependent endonuclease n=1 Tax=Leclercia adecarboxylata TaxID=83655 RepID=A0AAP9AKA0_9ENTR|nr:AAA family ATPase [Leclercia adecarboxylata]QDK19415.1 ATP-dependent endonuclease [Leclercia adecarboxylata]
MKLKTLKIENFRAINGDDNVITFNENNIVFVFGKNNIGKSSILHAYKYFTSPSEKAMPTDFHNHDFKKPIIIEAVFIKEELDDKSFAGKGLDKWVDRENQVKIRKVWVKINETAKKETFDPNTQQYVVGGFGGIDTILTNACPNIIYIEAIPNIKALTSWLDKEIKSRIIKNLQKNHQKEYDEAFRAVKALQEKVEGEDLLSEIATKANRYFNKTFPEMEIKIQSDPFKPMDLCKAFESDFSISIGPKSDDNVDIAIVEKLQVIKSEIEEMDSSGNYRQFDLHGHALIRQAIVNILGIFRDTKDGSDGADVKKNIILFEEPELYLHPSNKRRFRETLYDIASQDNYQIICISHDPQLIDLSKEHTSLVRFVAGEDGATHIYQTKENLFTKSEEVKEKVMMLNRFNPHICESFFADEVILVEGDTEAIVLRELLDRFYANKEIFVLNTGSKNNIPFFLEVLSTFKIRLHIIHDSDERYIYEKGVRVLKKDNKTPKANSAWSLNDTIWKSVENISNNGGYAKRYVSIRNFEHAHNYQYDKLKGKPLSAYEFSKTIGLDDINLPIITFLKEIASTESSGIEYTQDYLHENVQEPY